MVADLESRRRFSESIQAYLQESVDNFSLDDTLFDTDTQDELCRQIRRVMWCFYDDCTRHTNAGKRKFDHKHEQMIVRWVSLLRSDQEWNSSEFLVQTLPEPGLLKRLLRLLRPERPPIVDNEYWPFLDFERWEQFKEQHKSFKT